MAEYDFDFLVIGAGSGGVRASRVAAELGAKVAVVESRYLGGTCVNVGCVPKKLFVYASHFSEEFHAAQGYGWNIENIEHHWDVLRENKNKEIEYLNGVYQRLLEKAGVEIIRGHARIENAHEVCIGDRSVSCRTMLIATGGWPYIPQIPGAELAITSNEAFYLPSLPESIAIVGGGYIAVEFAGIFNGLGVETHLIYRGPQLLRYFDRDIGRHLMLEMEKKGIQFHLSTEVESLAKRENNKIEIALSNGQLLSVGQAMYATGRRPMTDNLGLENTSIQVNHKGEIVVDEEFRTAEHNIFALGDVTGGIELTPVAIAEGAALAKSLFGEAVSVDYNNIPTAVFSQPNVATVGLSEQDARERYRTIKIYETDFRDLKQSLAKTGERTYIKLVVDADTNRVLGCHMVGQHAGEIIQGFAVAMKAGATKEHFDQCIGIHPTAAEEFVTMRNVRCEDVS